MTNFQVYRKTLSFSLVEFLINLLGFAVLVGCTVLGFVIGNQINDMGILGLAVGFIVGIIAMVLITIFLANRVKAAQIAMMVKGVDEGNLPDHTFSAGMTEVKGRFGKITAFYFITNAIKGIFRQIGRGINKIGTAVGGQVGDTVTSAIDSAIQVLIGYLCDCCLGWILYRQEVNSFKAGCEGAVIFFKHGKTLFRNIGRIFGMGLLSFLLIGGALFGGFYLICQLMPDTFQTLANEIAEIGVRNGGDIPEVLTNPLTLMIAVAAVAAIIIWSMLHSVLIRPFILVGVLRNFMEAGKKDIPTEADFKELDGKSPRFAKLHAKF